MSNLLGLGPDGHIASLFPPTVVKEGFSKEHAVIHTTTTRFAVKDRITLTLPYITPAKNAVFFMTGEEKLAIWKEMISSAYNPERWPAHDVINVGNTTLLSG